MLKICSCQMEVTAGQPSINTQKMLSFIEDAKKNHVDIIIFPEMVIPGYLIGDSWDASSFLRDCEDCGQRIIQAADSIVIIFGNIAVDWQKKNHDGRVRKYNALFVAQNQQLLKPISSAYPFAIKTLQPNYREFDDSRYFYSTTMLADELEKKPEELINPFLIDIGKGKLCAGCILCEDGWSDDYPISPIDILNKKATLDIIFNISASPYTLGKNNKRNRIFSFHAKKNHLPLIYVNKVGIQNNGKTIYTFDGSSTVYDSNGLIVDCANPYKEECRYIDFPLTQKSTYEFAAFTKDDISSIYKALAYGTKKFLQNINMRKVVIGISGGIDSAVAAAFYCSIIGPENILLVNMPSIYNSEITKDLASQLAKNLGCPYVVVPIQNAVNYTIAQLTKTQVINPSNNINKIEISSYTTENIQARDRSGRILAGLAASIGGGFTCNANKAETTVGYSTLYGDQAGFLAVLADLWKHQIYALAKYLNNDIYHREVIPQATIDIVPSAELSANQNIDEGKGDPIKYSYHDYLFRAFVEKWDKAIPEDILRWYANGSLEEMIGCQKGTVRKYFANAQEFITDLEHWWNLFSGIAIAKRIQAPPIMAISRRAYGFDQREAQNKPYYTYKYKEIKNRLLNK